MTRIDPLRQYAPKTSQDSGSAGPGPTVTGVTTLVAVIALTSLSGCSPTSTSSGPSSTTHSPSISSPSARVSVDESVRTGSATARRSNSPVTREDICGAWTQDAGDTSRHWRFDASGTFQMQEDAGRQWDLEWEARGTWKLNGNLVFLTGRLEKPDTALTARQFSGVVLVVQNASTMQGGIYDDHTFRKTSR